MQGIAESWHKAMPDQSIHKSIALTDMVEVGLHLVPSDVRSCIASLSLTARLIVHQPGRKRQGHSNLITPEGEPGLYKTQGNNCH